MPAEIRVIYGFHGRYRTEQAIDRAAHVDTIPIPTSNTDMVIMHPVPIDWMRMQLRTHEYADCRSHLASILSVQRPQTSGFIKAVEETLRNLDSLKAQTVPGNRSATPEIPSRRVHFGNETPENENPYATVGTPRPPVTSPQQPGSGHHRTRSDSTPDILRTPTVRFPTHNVAGSEMDDVTRRMGRTRLSEREGTSGSVTAGNDTADTALHCFRDELTAMEAQLNEADWLLDGRCHDQTSYGSQSDTILSVHYHLRRLLSRGHVAQCEYDDVRARIASVELMVEQAVNEAAIREVRHADYREEPRTPRSRRRHSHSRRPSAVLGSPFAHPILPRAPMASAEWGWHGGSVVLEADSEELEEHFHHQYGGPRLF